MDKEILNQYSNLKAEYLDLQKRIRQLEKETNNMVDNKYQLSDSVKGTRPDGTYGSIRITGFPVPDFYRKRQLLQDRKDKLEAYEARLIELTKQVDDYINSLDDSRMRRMLRYRYMDNYSWVKTAHLMGRGYTADSCRKQVERYFEKNKVRPICPLYLC